MCPAILTTSRTRALETGEAKLWVLLVGVNHYEDDRFPDLAYSALDCQGLGEAIAAATQAFPQRSVVTHHDFGGGVAAQELESHRLVDQVAIAGRMRLGTVSKLRNFPALAPQLEAVRASLKQICAEAKPQDTVLFYFSGHGILEAETQQAVLCLTGTHKEDVLNTGLGVQELLGTLSECAAHQQLVWLDACHSGGMTFRGAKSELETLPNPTPQLVDLLRQRAAQSKGFYALLSCDQSQHSWEFPELGHGVFTYFLMRGLLGEAADAQGVIEVDTLYKYVYYQTLRYIDKTNQQLRLINQQKRGRGETQIQPEYPQQTPKRIVEGVGELILGIKPEVAESRYPRQALVVEGLAANPTTLELSKVLRGNGGFELNYFPQAAKEWTGIKEAIQDCFQMSTDHATMNDATTVLIYLRGRMEQSEGGEARLVLKDEVEISRSWLRQVLRKSAIARQIIIFDCPGAEHLAEWVEDLQSTGRGQCLIAAAAPLDDPEWFGRVLLETLEMTDPQAGLPIAGWIAQIQGRLAGAGIKPYLWLSGTQGVIEVLPGKMGARGETAFDLGVCPYLGLKAFSEDDAPFFFGREALTLTLMNQVSQQSFLAVIGASGSGKSSVVQAGLMAQLRQGKQIPDSEHWWIRCLRPGARPLESLVQRLVESGTEKERQYQKLQLEGMLYQGVEGFVHWLRSRPEPMIVLVVDQFEELFTLAPADERRLFLDLVLGGMEHAGDRFKLIITLRTDFIAPCLEYPALAQALQQSSLMVSPSLDDENYRQAIVRPAEKVGLKVESELVEVLLQELGQSGDLPLLEFVLEQIWEHRQPGVLTLQVYQQQMGGLKGALEQKAQSVYDSLDAESQACARWIFLSLTQLGEGTEDTRRRVMKSELVVKKYPQALIERTLQSLTAGKLIMISLEDAIADQDILQLLKQEVTIEVVHEILIRHWSTLRWWLEENRGRVRSQRQIEQAAAQWQHSNQQSDFLLRGVRLDAAEEIYVKYTDELSQDVQLFIEAGLQARIQEKEQAQQRLKRAKVAIAIISTLGIAAAGLGGFALLQRRQAMVNEITALNALSESQLLANQQLEAITTSLKASQQLRSLWGSSAEVKMQTVATLEQAIAETQERNRLEGHSQQVNRVVVSPDGQRIASGSDDQTVKIWKLDGTLEKTIQLTDRVTDLVFTQDALAASTADGKVTLLMGNSQRSLAIGNIINSIAFSPNGKLLATASRTASRTETDGDRTVKIWTVADGKLIKTLTGHSGWVNSVQFSPDGQTLASASEDKVIKLWNVATGSLIRNLTGHGERVTSVAFNPNGQTLVSGSGDHTVKLWNLSNGSAQTLEGHTDQVNSVQFSPDGKWIISAGQDHTLNLWQGITLVKTIKGHGAPVLSATFNAATILSASADKTVRLWNVPALQPMNNFTSIAFDSTAIALPSTATAQDKTIQLQHPNTVLNLVGHQLPISSLRFSPDHQHLASGSDDKTIKIWDLKGSLLHTLAGHQARINDLAFSPDGQLLASASEDKTIRLWKSDGHPIRAIAGHQDAVSRLAFSPDGRLLASGSYDNTVKLWQIDGTWVRSLEGMTAASLAFSPDGQTLAVGSWDNTIKVWRVRDGVLLRTLTGHLEGVTSLSFNDGGTILASGSDDHTIKLWSLEGDLIKTLRGGSDRVLGLGFEQNGLIRAGEVTGVERLDLDLGDLMGKGCDRLRDYFQTRDSQTCAKGVAIK
jgi:WD40 repeat protein/uncharacterized caspase-like protein